MDTWVASMLSYMNNAAMYMGVQISLQNLLSTFRGVYPEVEFLGHIVVLFFNFGGTIKTAPHNG